MRLKKELVLTREFRESFIHVYVQFYIHTATFLLQEISEKKTFPFLDLSQKFEYKR